MSRKLVLAALLCASPAFAEGEPDGPGPNLVIQVAGQANGTIVIDMLPDRAPKHVAQMTALATAGAYDNVVFHRVIDGFMAQTGDVQYGKAGTDLSMAGAGGSDMPNLPAEFSDVSFQRGIVGMARARPRQREFAVLHHVRAGRFPGRSIYRGRPCGRGYGCGRPDRQGRAARHARRHGESHRSAVRQSRMGSIAHPAFLSPAQPARGASSRRSASAVRPVARRQSATRYR